MQQHDNLSSNNGLTAKPVQTSKAAIASLIMGILGFVIPLIAATVGLILGIIGLRNTGKSKSQLTGRGLALAGTIVSGVSFMLWLLPVMLFLALSLVARLNTPKFEHTGGYKILCEVRNEESLDETSMNEACEALKQRIDPHGWLGILVHCKENQTIEVCVPVRETYPHDIDDPKNLLRLLTGRGVLEFRILPANSEGMNARFMGYRQALITLGSKQASDNRYVWCAIDDPENWPDKLGIVAQSGKTKYVLCSNQQSQTLLQGESKWKVKKAYQTTDYNGRPAIGFTFNEDQANQFFYLTSDNLDRPLAIILDNRVLSAPTINSAIRSTGMITGGTNGFTQTEVVAIVEILNAEPLPAAIKPIPESLEWIHPRK